MQKKRFIRLSCTLLCILLIAASALTLAGCGEKTPVGDTQSAVENTVSFTFRVVDLSGAETVFEIDTAEKTVGAALLAKNLIAGDPSEYGLYVKTVNGVTLDYAADNAYWALYIGESYAETGVDNTPITAGETYTFKAEKAQ